jgi:hypothetical protein
MENLRFFVYVQKTGDKYPVISRAAGEAKAAHFASLQLTAAVFDRKHGSDANPVTIARHSDSGAGVIIEKDRPENYGTIVPEVSK